MATSLRDRLRTPRNPDKPALVTPGVYDALTAALAVEAGFEAVFVSGAGVSYARLCRPDLGLVGVSEMADAVATVARAVDVPVIADGDNGYGNALNLMRAVELFEAAGASAIQIEDQAFPKRCGHMEGKRLVSSREMVGKIQAARAARRSESFLVFARTDARSVLGLEAALERAEAYREAGADAIFVEAPADLRELEAVTTALPDVPLVVNMVEGGKTPMVPARDLEALGFAIILYPNSLTRGFVSVGRSILRHLRAEGSTAGVLDSMVTWGELNALTGIDEMRALEARFVVSTDDDG